MSSEELKRLLALAAKPLRKPLKKLEYGSNVFQFISEMNIKSSEQDKIPAAIVYMKYYKWCEINQQKCLAISKFGEYFSKKFDRVSYRQMTCYKISPAGFDLSPSNEQDAREFLQEVQNRGKQKKESKKRAKAILNKKSSE